MGTVAKLKYGDTTHLIASTCYGTCPTEAGTVAKVATIQDSQAFSLINGITIHIKFTYSNTATNPTLNVNSTGAKAIKMYGTTATGKTSTASWYAGSVVSFTYDGTNWIQNDYKVNTNTTYSAGTGLSLSSTTFNHSNSITAQTTQKVYPIKIDAQGHISAYGTSPTTLSGYGITDAVLKSGDTMTGALTIKVTSTHDDNSPSRLLLQTVDSTNNVTSTGYIMAYDGGANGANLVIQPGGNMFLGSGEAANNHYLSAYTHSTGETMFITSDGAIHIQANGQTIANRVGVQIDTSGNLVPEKADVATNNIGSIGTSTYKWANGYFYNINGVVVGDSPEFTDTWRPINYVGKSAQGGLGMFPVTFLAGDNIDISLSSSSNMETLTIDATNTTYSAGTGLSMSGTTINHSNSITAKTTQAVYPVKIDAQGHITAVGTAATILALGNGASNAYYGDKGKTAYDHSQLTSGNPHNVTKSDVGLGNVGNFKAVSTVASQGLTTTEKSNARTNIGAGTVTSVTIKGGTGITVSDEAAITGSGTRTITNTQQGIYNVIGTQTSSTAAWTGTLSAVSALYDGLTICYFLPYASAASTNVTLNLTLADGTTTGAVACYLSTSRLTTHYAKGTNIIMTYYKKGSISIDGTATTAARWIAHADYNTNTNTWRNIYINGTSKTGTSTGTGYVNYKSGNSITVTGTYTTNTKTDITFSIPSTTAPTYTVTSSSSSNKWSDASIVATRWGNVVQIVLRLSGTGSSVTAGTDGYTGTVSGTYMPSRQVTLMGYTGKTLLMGWLETNGTLTVRANEATQVASGNGLWLTGTFVTDTDTTG